MKKMIGFFFVLTIMLVATNSQASFITSSGDAALAGASVDDMSGWLSGNWSGASSTDLSYVADDNHLRFSSTYSGSYNTTGQSLNNGTYSDPGFSSLTITFNHGTSGFGFNWGAAEDFASWQLAAYDAGDTLLESYALPSTGSSNAGEFYGIAASNISYAKLSWGGDYDWVFIDNMTYATTSAVPEPSTIVLLGAGLLGLAFVARRRNEA